MINDEIREITRRFVEALHPEKVILFGSYAKDTYREDSDYDFYIVMPDETKENNVTVMQNAYVAIDDMKDRNACDILANKAGIFEHRSMMPTMERIVKREGVVLYGE